MKNEQFTPKNELEWEILDYYVNADDEGRKFMLTAVACFVKLGDAFAKEMQDLMGKNDIQKMIDRVNEEGARLLGTA
jgi:hypothetical protein